jgi:Flp pilus assembly pilin Flp
MRVFINRWLNDESGQDLIEYALLVAFIAFAGVAGFNFISSVLSGTYTGWNNGVQDLWEVPEP